MLKKIFEILKIIFLLKFDFFLPSKKKFLLFDDNHKNYILKYLDQENLNVLHIRKEKINLPVVLLNFLKLKFTFRDYIEKFIDLAEPKYIITFSDNSESFFLLKKRERSKKILIQNSWKNKFNDPFLNIQNKKYHSDYSFVFNEKIGNIYTKLLSCKSIVIGSFKSNCYKLNDEKKKYPILFISSFRNIKPSKLLVNEISYSDYDLTHKKAIKEIAYFANQKKIKLYIYGNDLFAPLVEENYFKELKLNCDWEFIKNDRPKTYNIIDRSTFVVGTHSTALYEAIGRGQKIFVFSKNFDNEKLNTHMFGWPYDFGKEGFFWINNFLNRDLIQQKIEKVFNLNQIDWDNKIDEIKKKVMNFDDNNKSFVDFIKYD